jgi:CTP synthase
VYEVPLLLEEAGLADYVANYLGIKPRTADLNDWRRLVDLIKHPDHRELKIGVVAKYMDNEDTYLCVFEALKSAGWANRVRPEICWIDAEKLEEGDTSLLEGYDGIVVPGGFGQRGLEGKIIAGQYSLLHDLPYLGLCLGLQMGVIAAARNAGLKDATTFELDPGAMNLVINTMNDQKGKEGTGGTMRLGNYHCVIEKDSKVAAAYGTTRIDERHRHRGECNNEYRDQYESWGIRAVGLSPDKQLVEIIEGIDHPFFVASQFHPEFKSRPNRPHPLFDAFIKAALTKHNGPAAKPARRPAGKTVPAGVKSSI